jgi:casein kinase 1
MLLRGCGGIPSVHYYGQEGNFYCLVMDLLGDSLEELFEACGRKFSVQTVAQLGVQMVKRSGSSVFVDFLDQINP